MRLVRIAEDITRNSGGKSWIGCFLWREKSPCRAAGPACSARSTVDRNWHGVCEVLCRIFGFLEYPVITFDDSRNLLSGIAPRARAIAADENSHSHLLSAPQSGVMSYFDVEYEYAEAAGVGMPMSVLVVRVDDYETFQPASEADQHDSVLERLSAAFGDGCAIASLGGDEFVVLLRGVQHFPELLQILEYAQSRVRKSGRSTKVSSSFKTGVARCPLDDDNFRTLLVLAGRAVDDLEADTPDFQFVDGRHRRSLGI